MPISSAWNAYIFREGKTTVSGPALVADLAKGVRAFPHLAHSARRTTLIDLLLRAGELECTLHDSESAQAAIAEGVTDQLAESLVRGTPVSTDNLFVRVRDIEAPARVPVAITEGFAYYSLHPFDYVDLVRRAASAYRRAAIVGIRSIGTTLGSIVQAALRAQGAIAERITVRPIGHPYNRRTTFSSHQQRWITSLIAEHADFFIVDEGPGMSGSSFLSVGDALLSAGVPRSQITFLCSRQPDPASLTAANAAQRWPAFRAYYTEPTRHLPLQAKQYIAGGIWRARAFPSEDEWPSSWLQMERLKFLSEDCSRLYRFEGFGRFGAEVHQRALTIAEAGFGPTPEPREEGFGVYPVLNGRYLSSADASPATLMRIAEYCAFRACALASDTDQTPDLEVMLRFNTSEEFGVDLPAGLSHLEIEKPVIADGRMLPHKWINHDGKLLKLDAATHGDDHFFPGPTDIAWDLAGTIVEWDLNTDAANFLIDTYRQFSGDDLGKRLPAYLLAYGVFRTAYCKMAAAASSGTPEHERLLRDYHRYRRQTQARLGCTPTGHADQQAAA